MKKLQYNIFVAVFLMLIICGSEASNLSIFAKDDVSMQVPNSIKVKIDSFKDAFPEKGCCYLKSNTAAVMVLINKFPGQDSIDNSLVKLTGIELKDWTAGFNGKNLKKGWVSRKDYQAFAGGTAVYAITGQGAKSSYLIVLCADKNNFVSNPADYKLWAESVSVNSAQNKPQ